MFVFLKINATFCFVGQYIVIRIGTEHYRDRNMDTFPYFLKRLRSLGCRSDSISEIPDALCIRFHPIVIQIKLLPHVVDDTSLVLRRRILRLCKSDNYLNTSYLGESKKNSSTIFLEILL